MAVTRIPFELIGTTGKTLRYTFKLVNGVFVSTTRHYAKMDKVMKPAQGLRVYQNRHVIYSATARGHPEQLPPSVARYKKDKPVFREEVRRLRPVHRAVSRRTMERRGVREAILKVIQDIRQCSYRQAQFVYKSLLVPLGEFVEFNSVVPLDPIHLVVQFSDSPVYLVFVTPDYWLGDEQIITAYLRAKPEVLTYKDLVWGRYGILELQSYLNDVYADEYIQSLENAVVIGAAGKCNNP